MILYDIINLRPIKIEQKSKKISDTEFTGQPQNARRTVDPSTPTQSVAPASDTDNVPQSGDVVNSYDMQNERNYPQSILDRDAQRVWAQMEGYEE